MARKPWILHPWPLHNRGVNPGRRTDKGPNGQLTKAARKYNQWLANKIWREKNRDRWREISRKWYRDTKEIRAEKIKAKKRRYYLKHQDELKAKSARYRQMFPDKARAIQRASAIKHAHIADYHGNRCISCTSVLPDNMLFCDWCLRNVPKQRLKKYEDSRTTGMRPGGSREISQADARGV